MDCNFSTEAEISKQTDKNNEPISNYHENCTEQAHSITIMLPSIKGIIYCYVLSMWDNIVGPKAVYAWKIRNEPFAQTKNKIDHDSNGIADDEVTKRNNAMKFADIIKYVAEHSISVGDVNKCGGKHVNSWLTSPHQNIAFLSVRFALEEAQAIIPCSLSCITYYVERHKMRPYFEICFSQMQVVANKLSLLFIKEGLSGAKRVTKDLVNLTSSISSLMNANPSVCNLKSLPESPVDRHLAALMLTSHLQTHCSTLIIATSLNEANKVILWLSQFSPRKNLPLSCLCLSENNCLYSNAPSIQAVIRDYRGEVDIPTTTMLCTGRPLTIVDLTENTVRQFAPSASQQGMCIQALHAELVEFAGCCRNVGAISRSIFHPVEVIAPLVKNFLQEWSCLAECDPSVRREYLNTFKQSLYYSALSISVFVRSKCQGMNYDEKSEMKQDFKPDLLLRAIKSVLQLHESDLKLLLAHAESFDPGITSFVFR